MNPLWNGDEELFALARRELFSAVIGDVMDKSGFRRQFLPPEIRPLDPSMVVVGRAKTVLEADCFEEPDPPFGRMLEALDGLRPNEVYTCAGASPTYALWGELMSVRAIRCGAAGAVMDGYSRDTAGILSLGFPTFSFGAYAQDQGPRGKVIDMDVPIEIGQARICPGDILFGDRDGVCVVPRASEADIIRLAVEKARGEKTVRSALEEGMTAADAFRNFGIL